MNKKGKIVTTICSFFGILVIILTGILLKEKIIENWYLYLLKNSNNKETLIFSARKLGELKSSKSIPFLVSYYSKYFEEDDFNGNLIPILVDEDGKIDNRYLPFYFALMKIVLGSDSCIPYLVSNLKSKDNRERIVSTILLGYVGKKDVSAIIILMRLLDDENKTVRLNAALALIELDVINHKINEILNELSNETIGLRKIIILKTLEKINKASECITKREASESIEKAKAQQAQ